MRDFEATYAAYDEFQRADGVLLVPALAGPGRHGVASARKSSARNLVRIAGAPLYVRVPSLPGLPPGTPVEVEIAEVDLIDTHLRVRL